MNKKKCPICNKSLTVPTWKHCDRMACEKAVNRRRIETHKERLKQKKHE